jgi:DNA (cytosine-5)-methyltransferase 1
MQDYLITKVMRHRNAPRIWLQGRVLETAGFLPGSAFLVEKCESSRQVRLVKDCTGSRHVSAKQKLHKVLPVLDINSGEVLDVFALMDRVKVIALLGMIVLMPVPTDGKKTLRLDRLLGRMKRGESLQVASLSHGGGMLAKALHKGLLDAGVSSDLALANDIDNEMLEHASVHNPTWSARTMMLSAPMQELAFDQQALAALPQCDVLEAGIPCTGASVAGRAKNGTACAEQHPDVGHLVVSFLILVAAINPAIVVLENVPPYQSSASMWIVRHQLRDLGYVVHETVLNAKEWGVLDCRRRMCMVAVTEGLQFDFQLLQPPKDLPAPTVADILEDVPLDSPVWSPMTHLTEKAERDIAQGKNFRMQVVDGRATWIRTMGKGYGKNRSTEPKYRHPAKPELMRPFTPVEHARSKGEDPAMLGDLAPGIAHGMLGQGIACPPFIGVGQLLGNFLRFWAGLTEWESLMPLPVTRMAEDTAAEVVPRSPIQLSLI